MIPAKHSERMYYFRNNDFVNDEILPYLIEHVANFKRLNPNLTRKLKKEGRKYQIYDNLNHPILSPILGEILTVLVDKILNSRKFMRYTPDWKEDLKTYAFITTCKYIHHFDSKKYNNNAIGYLYNSVEQNIIQELKNIKKKSSLFQRLKFSAPCEDEGSWPDFYLEDLPIL